MYCARSSLEFHVCKHCADSYTFCVSRTQLVERNYVAIQIAPYGHTCAECQSTYLQSSAHDHRRRAGRAGYIKAMMVHLGFLRHYLP